MKKLKSVFHNIRIWIKEQWIHFKLPSKGICPVCKKKVRHVYPWWTKNPERDDDAKPLHKRCAAVYYEWDKDERQ